MEVTIIKPAVTDPSHMPRIKRVTKRPAKLPQADVHANVMPQTKILTLINKICLGKFGGGKGYIPYPFTHRETLEGEILREFEQQITKVKDSPQPNHINYRSGARET